MSEAQFEEALQILKLSNLNKVIIAPKCQLTTLHK